MKTSKMARKTLKKLDRVEALLSKVIDYVAKDEEEVRALLDSARASIARASVKAKTWVKAKSPVKQSLHKKKRSRAEKSPESPSSADGKKGRKRIVKSRTSNRSKARKARAAATEATPPIGSSL